MESQEIPRERWAEFFEDYGLSYAGWIVDLEWPGHDSETASEMEYSLEGIEGDFENGEGRVTIYLSDREAIVVEDIVSVSLWEGEDSEDELLEIEGSETLVHMHLRFPDSEIRVAVEERGSDADGIPRRSAPAVEDELSVLEDSNLAH